MPGVTVRYCEHFLHTADDGLFSVKTMQTADCGYTTVIDIREEEWRDKKYGEPVIHRILGC